MDFEQYFRDRGEVVRSVLQDADDDQPMTAGRRSFAAGLGIVVTAIALQFWAAGVQTDPGYFARTTTFMAAVLGSGVWLLSAALMVDYRLTRFAVGARTVFRERTIRQMLRADGLLARHLASERDNTRG